MFDIVWHSRENGFVYPYQTPYSQAETDISKQFNTGTKCHTR